MPLLPPRAFRARTSPRAFMQDRARRRRRPPQLDDELVAAIRKLIAGLPTYGCRASTPFFRGRAWHGRAALA